MFTAKEAQQTKHPDRRFGHIWRDDHLSFPAGLENSPKIRKYLDYVTHSYIYWLFAASAEGYKYGDSDPNEDFSDTHEMVWYKVLHTNDVIWAIMRLFEEGHGFTLEDAVCVALIHDNHRAAQGGFFHSYSDNGTGMNHGENGAVVVGAHLNKDGEDYHIIHAAAEHGVLNVNQEKLTYLVKLIRDADKAMIMIRMFEFQVFSRSGGRKGSEISHLILKAFIERRTADTRERKTEADEYVYYLAWIWDLNFNATKLLIAQSGVLEEIMQRLENLPGINKVEFAQIRAMIDVWYLAIGFKSS